MNPDIYAFMERSAPYLVFWSLAFTLVTLVRFGLRLRRGAGAVTDSATLTELAGLPLTLLQPVCFVWAAITADWRSMLLFVWWGPGLVATAVALGVARARRRRIDWHGLRYVISYLCKLYYLAYMTVFWIQGMRGMIFAFSVWIINDQCEKALVSLDADRLRRTFDDYWLFRVLYPAGLLIPWFSPAMAFRGFSLAYGALLLMLWGAGILYVAGTGKLLTLPADTALLRNMVYFRRLRP